MVESPVTSAPASSPPAEPAAPRVRRAAPSWLVRLLLLATLVGGSLLRIERVARPYDDRSLAPWREADYVAIARDFARDELDPFHPRVDWRGDTPGYAEMELPLLPWCAGLLDRVFGYHEQTLRMLAALASLAALWYFPRVAALVLPPLGVLAATLFFAANPLANELGAAMQPESLMVLFVLLAIARLWRFEENGAPKELLLAAAFTAAATLAKAPAACLGLLLFDAVVRRHRGRLFTHPEVAGAAALALLPPLAWYAWAHRFWSEYGLSLGLSNETHWINRAVLATPDALLGNLDVEHHFVFTWTGALLAVAALLLRPPRLGRPLRFGLAALVFYVAAADTSGDRWAFYYHVLSAAPAALLCGAGAVALLEKAKAVGAAGPAARPLLARALVILAGCLVVATTIKLTRATFDIASERDHRTEQRVAFDAAQQFAAALTAPGAIVVCGGDATDAHGHPVAHSDSTWFAWLDRKGFVYAREELGTRRLDEFATRGARYWIAAAKELADPNLRAAVAARYPVVADHRGAWRVFDLRPERH